MHTPCHITTAWLAAHQWSTVCCNIAHFRIPPNAAVFGSDSHIYSCSYCGAVYLPLSAPPVTNQQSMVSTVFPLSLEYFQLLQDSLKLTLKKFQQYMADQWLAILAWWVYSINYTKKSNSLIQTFTYPRL